MDLQDFKNLTEEMVEDSIAELKELNNLGVIDPHSNLSSGERAVYIISGSNDGVVPPEN